jgi:hypothetical protein
MVGKKKNQKDLTHYLLNGCQEYPNSGYNHSLGLVYPDMTNESSLEETELGTIKGSHDPSLSGSSFCLLFNRTE